ncbi:MAG TPA: aminotransferase class IV [Chitinophagaceae bacterium]|nr:aminotransferase class IV [Chitinophagaceae bacterium]
MNKICLNGKIISGDRPVLMAGNRGFRYGDALFETMKIIKGNIPLEKFHFERLLKGLEYLKFEVSPSVNATKLAAEIIELCEENKCNQLARVRLTVFRGNGSLYEDSKETQYLIECRLLDDSVNELNQNDFLIDIYPDARKSCDKFSNLKTANYLPYVMAALYAKEKKLNECIILNANERICDATIANIFLVKNKTISTPSLSEGCVGGVMRKYLLKELNDAGYQTKEKPVTLKDIENADEVFLTNAINGIRRVSQFRNKIYSSAIAEEINNRFFKAIFL